MNVKAIVMTILLSGALSSALHADEDTPFGLTGMIDRIDEESNQIVVNDMVFNILPYVLVHKDRGKFIGLQYLKQSIPIRYVLDTSAGKPGVVKEVWVLERLPTPGELRSRVRTL